MSRTFPAVSAYARRAYGASGLWDGRLLDSYLDESADVSPDGLAVVDGAARLTYAQLRDHVERIATGLRGLGVGPRDVVSMQLPNWWEALATHLAVLRIGAVSNPAMPILRDGDLAPVLERGGCCVLVAAAEFRGYDHGALALRMAKQVPTLEHVVVVRGERPGALSFADLCASADDGGPTPGRTADDPVVLLYTSGTESRPKGAVHSHNTLGYENRSMIDLYAMTTDDVVWAPSPVAHITGVLFAIHLSTMLAAPVVLQDIWDPAAGLRLIAAERCSVVVAATPFLHGITYAPELASTDVSSLRVFVCGGADVPPDLIRDAQDRLGVPAMRLYGSTEIPTVTSSPHTAPLSLRAGTDGRPIADDEVRVVDDTGAPVAVGEPGRLLARGPEAMLGYLDVDPQPFDEQGWFDTGDRARLSPDGYVTLVGRTKDIILRGGENISAKEVEDLLYGHPGIADVAVVAVPDQRLTEKACAVVVARPGATVDLPSITAYLDGLAVARQKYPERIHLVEELPRTPTGKVQKFALRALIADRAT